MIRVVLAVILSAALVAVSIPAVEQATTSKSKGEAERALVAVEQAATDLYTDEPLPPRGVVPPQRSVTVSFPRDGQFSKPVESIEIIRVPDEPFSRIEYTVDGEKQQVIQVDAPIVDSDGNRIELGGPSGERTYVLTLERDPGSGSEPVVVFQATSRRE